jgi:hypothetical protein
LPIQLGAESAKGLDCKLNHSQTLLQVAGAEAAFMAREPVWSAMVERAVESAAWGGKQHAGYWLC